MSLKRLLPILGAFIVFGLSLVVGESEPARMDSVQRGMALDVLKNVADAIRKNYYDSKYHGIDFEGRVNAAEKRIKEVGTVTEAMGAVGWMAEGVNDTHTFFIPPPKAVRGGAWLEDEVLRRSLFYYCRKARF
jgi:hypothetical protein